MVFITFAGNLRHGATGKEGRPLRRGHQHRYAAIGKMVAPTTGTSTSARGDRKNGRPDDGDINIGTGRPEKWSPRRRGYQHRHAAIGKMVAPTTGTSTSARGDRKNGIHHVCRKPSARGDRKKWSPPTTGISTSARGNRKNGRPDDGDINIGTRRPEKWSSSRLPEIFGTGRPEKMVAPYDGDINIGTGRPEKKVAPYDGDINIGTRRPEKWSPLR
jgi:hypothetical protein